MSQIIGLNAWELKLLNKRQFRKLKVLYFLILRKPSRCVTSWKFNWLDILMKAYAFYWVTCSHVFGYSHSNCILSSFILGAHTRITNNEECGNWHRKNTLIMNVTTLLKVFLYFIHFILQYTLRLNFQKYWIHWSAMVSVQMYKQS